MENRRRLLRDLDIGVRVVLQVLRQDIREYGTGNSMLDADMDKMRAAEAVAGALLVLLLELEYLLGRLQKLTAVRGQAQRPAADKQRGAQLLLQLCDLLGERLLLDKQMLGRCGKALFVGHGSEAFQQ